MDISDNYIYVLVFIGIVVFNIVKTLRQSNNKEEVRRTAPEVDVSEYEEEECSKNRRRNDGQFSIPEMETECLLKSEMEPVVDDKMHKKTSSSKIFEEERNASRIELKTAEEARRAFLYSEIWNRKY
ncbi:MAG: hypothetical protein WCU80_00340 [Paludibacteraceae bacterium]